VARNQKLRIPRHAPRFTLYDLPLIVPTLFYSKKEFLKMNLTAECPECAAEVSLPEDVMEGEIVQCPDCGVELEVISVDPPALDLAPEEEEDWGE
jgi:alpha-aminoadipate carrier protein LysW